VVEAGLGRMDLTDFHDPEAYNQKMLRLAEGRYDTAQLWENAFSDIPEGRFLRPIKELILPRKLITSRFILMMAGDQASGLRHAFGRFLRERRMRGVAEALLKHLQANETISSSEQKYKVEVKSSGGKIRVSLPNASSKDQALFSECLDQCFDAFYMPTYFLCKGTDYLMIPKAISKNKKAFHRSIKSVGFRRYKLLSTASFTGQQELLKIRNSFLLNIDQNEKAETKVRWQV